MSKQNPQRSPGGYLAVFVVSALLAGCGATTGVETVPPISSPLPATTSMPTTTSIPTTTSSSTTTTLPANTLAVPRGVGPVLDGDLDDPGWDVALVTPVDDDLSLYWLHDEGTLYLGVRYPRIGAVNLVVGEGDRVRVLHSSAALGSASYSRQDDGSWELQHGFEWCCRVGSDPTGADRLLQDEGWAASIGTIGVAGQVEFRLELGPGDTWVALSWVGPTGEAIVWPSGLPADQELALYGFRTEIDVFVPESWTLIELEG